ncbi:MAG: WYL domain-containing transcriptional regulator [Ruminococcus sp.]|nr:WYL domain-containing transcriptional regulator [Ruminococcus sp.]
MGGFSELIKNFNNTRDYIKDFFIYGFKVRSDFDKKSLRTYDDEKRRIESWFGDYIKYNRTARGQNVSISVDSGTVSENPLYNAYYSKSFTDNDIKLHFFILDVLHGGKNMSVKEIANAIDENFGIIFDMQIIRKKLNEYADEGLVISEKSGKTSYFKISPDRTEDFLNSYEGLTDAVKFFSENQEFGIIGNSILKSAGLKNDIFVMKHNYIVHTLEDIIIPEILTAIRQKKYISYTSFRTKNNTKSIGNIVPMQIFASVQTGRRYLAGYIPVLNKFNSFRLDFIKSVRAGEKCGDFDMISEKFDRDKQYCFGVSFGNGKPEKVVITFYIDEKSEKFVIERLEREKRNGKLEKIGSNLFRLTVKSFDTFEVMQWARTFTGRIISAESENQEAIERFYGDIKRLDGIYRGAENETVS